MAEQQEKYKAMCKRVARACRARAAQAKTQKTADTWEARAAIADKGMMDFTPQSKGDPEWSLGFKAELGRAAQKGRLYTGQAEQRQPGLTVKGAVGQ